MSMLRNFATVGGATATSRLLGFVRDMFIAAALGTGPVADAFVVAFRFPNLFRRLFAEGAFNSAFIPLFARSLEGEGQASASRFAGEAAMALLTVLLVLTALCEIAMPLLMYVMAPGFAADPAKFDLAILLTRIAFPYLTLVSLLALVSGVLNGLGRFAAAALAPALLNVVLIATLLFVFFMDWADTPEAGIALTIGTVIGGIAQLLLVVYAMRRAGFHMPLRRPALTAGVKRLARLAVPGVVAGGVTQINIVVGTMIASMSAGAVSYLYYADRLYQLPLGIVGVAIGVVLLPDISRRLRADDLAGTLHAQNRAIEFSLILTLPATVALIAMPLVIVSALFQRGAFGPADSVATANAVIAFAIGLPAFVLNKVFSPAFFAREDTATPMRFAIAGVVTNIVVSLALFPFFAHVGIALATSIAGWLNTGLLARGLLRANALVVDARLKTKILGSVAASILMGIAIVALRWLLDGTMPALLLLVVLVLAGIVAYSVAAVALKVTSPSEIRRMMRRSS
ncbi:MAG: murein biosynthesis integral membrane protein MurJ [Rhodobiaceae bacterium]|nr:murein biosynthesis integral membrane protein MurJ [Rhodobiaceae bacterium]MCC0055389.1 murein biosynthesis integral membrane protein MurJ [Rhodobiaceae bacterium]